MKVAAFDLSLTGTGIININGNPSTLTTKLKDEPRLAFLLDKVMTIADDADRVILEGLARGSFTGKADERAGLHYMVRTELWKKNKLFTVVYPNSLKTYATGKGNAGKDEVLVSVVKMFPNVTLKDNNQCDAMTLWAMAWDNLGSPIVDLPKTHRRALEKVQWWVSS